MSQEGTCDYPQICIDFFSSHMIFSERSTLKERRGAYRPSFAGFVDVDLSEKKILSLRSLVRVFLNYSTLTDNLQENLKVPTWVSQLHIYLLLDRYQILFIMNLTMDIYACMVPMWVRTSLIYQHSKLNRSYDTKLILFQIDNSVVESFGAGGRTCISSRVYPTLALYGNAHLYAFNNGNQTVQIDNLNAWSMKTPPKMNQ